MNISDQKVAVLVAVKAYNGQVALSDLMKQLGEGFAARSVRRWLGELVQDGLIKRTGQKKGTRYEAAPVQEPLPSNPEAVFSDASAQVLSYVKQRLYLREPISYRLDWLESYEPNQTFYLTQKQREFLRQEGGRRYQYDIAGTYARHIYNRLIIDLSYNSSRLEGNTYSLLETEKLILEGDAQPSKLDEEAVMILNHKEAIRYLVDNAALLKIEYQTICTIHYLLLDGLLAAEKCGNVRSHGVKIGGSSYLPLDNKIKIESILTMVCNKAEHIVDPYEQSFFLLTHIAYLQAFEDSNKRTSRLSANIPLIRENLAPMSFNDVPKEDYTSAMIAVYELNNTQPLAELYSYFYLRTCKQYDISIESVGFNKIKIKYRQQRREVIREIIHGRLTGKEILSFIKKKSELLIPEFDREQFVWTVQEDITVLTISHIMGMRISVQEFNAWKSLQ